MAKIVQTSAQSAQFPAQPPRHRRRLDALLWISSLGLVVSLVTVILIANRPKPTIVTQQSVYPGVPDSFTDFSGTVASVNPTGIVVNFSGLNNQGTIIQKQYTVTTDASTKYQEMKAAQGTISDASFTASTLHVDDTVIVAAKENIAQATAFTASSIILLRSN